MVKATLGRTGGNLSGQGLAGFHLEALPRFAQVELFLSTCSNLFWLVREACGHC